MTAITSLGAAFLSNTIVNFLDVAFGAILSHFLRSFTISLLIFTSYPHMFAQFHVYSYVAHNRSRFGSGWGILGTSAIIMIFGAGLVVFPTACIDRFGEVG